MKNKILYTRIPQQDYHKLKEIADNNEWSISHAIYSAIRKFVANFSNSKPNDPAI